MQKYIVFITEELSALPSLDHPRDRREEPVRDGQQRLVEVRARVDAPGRRDEDVEHPGAADVDAHARDRGVAGGDLALHAETRDCGGARARELDSLSARESHSP